MSTNNTYEKLALKLQLADKQNSELGTQPSRTIKQPASGKKGKL